MLLKQCGTICDHSEIKCKLQHLREKKSVRSSVIPSDDVTLYVKIRYIVLSNTGAPSLEQIQAQHNLINRVCNREHVEELQTVPTNSYYANFASVIDKPWNIRFLPIDRPLSEDDIERHVISENTVFSHIDEITRQPNNYIKPGVLNCYITKLKDNLLGQAYVARDPGIFVIDIGTVGGVDSNGNIVRGTGVIHYDTGKTAIHEIGHCFGLEHTFYETCEPDEYLYDDIPLQKHPNYDAIITQNLDGEYIGANDNRYWDCNAPGVTSRFNFESPFSCIDSTDCSNENSSYEMFFNVMDYGSDALCLVFTHTQVATVRNFLIMTDMYIQKEDLEPNNNNKNTDDDSQIKKTTTKNCKHDKNTWIYWLPIIIISVVLFISGIVGIFVLVKKSKVT